MPFVLGPMGNIKAKKGNAGHPVRETRNKYKEECSSHSRDGNRMLWGRKRFFSLRG